MTAKTPPKPGRKPTAPTPAAPVVIDGAEAFDRLGESAVALAAHDATGADRDLLNQLLGQAQMADAFAKFSKTVFISKLAFVKERKLYQAISSGKSEDGLHSKGTWDNFCHMLGWTPQHANEAIDSLKSFGEDALESMSRMGIGYRELRQYRRLPDDHKLALIEAAKGGDKSDFLDLAEELITRHAREKEAQQRQLDDAAGKVAARDKLIAAKDEKINDLSLKAERFGAPGDEGRAAITEQLGALTAEAVQIVQGAMRLGFAQLVQAHGGMAHAPRDLMAGLVGQLRRELLLLQEEFGLPELVGDGKPEWLRGAEAMEAEDAAQARKKAPKTAH
jgi:hypothetical protein